MKQNTRKTRFTEEIEIFKEHGGILRTTGAMQAGIHPAALYALRDSGIVERVSRGLYRLVDSEPLGNPDLTAVALLIPDGVICLISALALHEITTQIPHQVHVALRRGAETPRLDFPPVTFYRFSGDSFTEGAETLRLEDVAVRVYSPEKTLADCFKFRNRIGLDTSLEALRLYIERKTVDVDRLMWYAKVCRVSAIIRPYLEALL